MSKRLGAGVSSSHSLASDTSEGTRRRVRRKGGNETAISPAGSNARSSLAVLALHHLLVPPCQRRL